MGGIKLHRLAGKGAVGCVDSKSPIETFEVTLSVPLLDESKTGSTLDRRGVEEDGETSIGAQHKPRLAMWRSKLLATSLQKRVTRARC